MNTYWELQLQHNTCLWTMCNPLCHICNRYPQNFSLFRLLQHMLQLDELNNYWWHRCSTFPDRTLAYTLTEHCLDLLGAVGLCWALLGFAEHRWALLITVGLC